MTICTVPVIVERIKAATRLSPIAVFSKLSECRKKIELNAMFADTVYSARDIENSSQLVGVFNCTDNKDIVLKRLNEAAEL